MNKIKSKIVLFLSCCLLLLSIFASAVMIRVVDFNSVSTITKEILGATIGGPKKDIGKCRPESYEEVTVEKIIDGDTIGITGGCADKIRLLYIDTPETVKPNTPVQCYGPEASDYLKSKLSVGSKVYLQSDKQSNDQYGRSLRILYFEKEDLDNIQKSYNYEVVAKGYGVAKFYAPNKKYQSEMLRAQEIATRQNLGLWQVCN